MTRITLLVLFAYVPTVRLAAQHPEIQAQLHGLILINAFANSDAFNNSDVPQFLAPAASGPSQSAAGATIRQSRLTATALVPEFAGGQLTGELDVDFFGGQQPSTGGRTFPLLRIRRAFAELTRGQVTVFVGQESPPIVEINPSSLASIGFPEFAGARQPLALDSPGSAGRHRRVHRSGAARPRGRGPGAHVRRCAGRLLYPTRRRRADQPAVPPGTGTGPVGPRAKPKVRSTSAGTTAGSRSAAVGNRRARWP